LNLKSLAKRKKRREEETYKNDLIFRFLLLDEIQIQSSPSSRLTTKTKKKQTNLNIKEKKESIWSSVDHFNFVFSLD